MTDLPMTMILATANRVAKQAKFRHNIAPIEKWTRPTTIESIEGFDLVSAGVLTSPESCVINRFREAFSNLSEAATAQVIMIYVRIAHALDLKTIGDVRDTLGNADKFAELCKEHEISHEEQQDWNESFKNINSNFNVESAKEIMDEHTITFVMAMRCRADWDYHDTLQLSDKEREAILEFIRTEEGVVVGEQTSLYNAEPKKP